MKKGICLLLVLLLLLLPLTACKASNTNYSSFYQSSYEEIVLPVDSAPSRAAADSQKTPAPTTEKSKKAATTKRVTAATTSKKEAGFTPDIEEYEVDCRSVASSDWEKIQISDYDKALTFRLEIPYDWTITRANADTLNIVCDGRVIGTIEREDLPASARDFRFGNVAKVFTQVTYEVSVESDGAYRCFTLLFRQNGVTYTVNVTLDYTALDENACRDFTRKFVIVPQEQVYIHPSEGNTSRKILVVGNSFVATSRIGEFLNDMLQTDGSRYYVDPISIGMANVTTFESDAFICNSIRSGTYSYVFLCGLYSDEAVRSVSTIQECCEASDTVLVLFPAHNESASAINKAKDAYSELLFLDWKGEINALIASGVLYDDFCINDYHKHSTPLAGYVGAHMIYRKLFKKTPPTLSNFAPLSERDVYSKLANYIDNDGVIAGYNDTVEEDVVKFAFG